MNENLYIIKVGGNIIDDAARLESFLSAFSQIRAKKLLVHGGGKLATKLAADLNIPQQMVEGRRITDAATLNIVTMVYAGLVNKQIVASLNAKGTPAIGMTGADATCILAHKRIHPTIDYGFVGDVDSVNVKMLSTLLDQELSIVMAPITQDASGQLLNTNADTIAQELAKALARHYATTLIYSFEKKGVLRDINDENSAIPLITRETFEQLKSEDAIFAGMIPKLENALKAVEAGVNKVIIGDAMDLHELITGKNGTAIC
ncbi:MAG: acetylglutamate kinase [Bacteroidota bacterium]